ncbi:MAG: YibE/F family protein [Clostridiales bacterium]|jgi:uncharacterized membrane protein|nr:YibE/F family protein [Clostridiales bacterium]
MKTKRSIITAVTVLLFIAFLACAIAYFNKPDPNAVKSAAWQYRFVTVKVLEVLYDDASPDYIRSEGRRLGTQSLRVEIMDGIHKGDVATCNNYLSALANIDLKVGDTAIMRVVDYDDGTYSLNMQNYNRGPVYIAFIIVFFVLVIALGGKKGAMSLLGLVFTLICLWFLLLPMMRQGISPIPATILIVIITAAVSLFLLDGITKKSVSAVISCIGGTLIAGLCAFAVGVISPMNGWNTGEAETLMLQATDHGLNISGLLVCSIIISALGATMDVAMSISSAISEIHSLNPQTSSKNLFISGMNIGRDAMGTMTNTLILAFCGSSLNMLILTQAYDIPLKQLINTDIINIEILQGVAGSIGIVLTVPLVAFISSKIMKVKA